MRWIRSNIRGFVRLALFALAVQFALTFGHVHLHGLAPASAPADQIAAPSVQADDQRRQSQNAGDFDCPICALIQLASTSAPSVAPPLPTPITAGGVVLETPAASDVAAPSTPAFRARGPPSL